MHTAIVLALALANSPPAIRGDFDHDGLQDVAEFRPVGARSAQLIVRRGAQGHPIAVIETFSREELGGLFLKKEPPGRWQAFCDDGPCRNKFVVLKGDTLAFGGVESSEVVAIWTGKKFELVWLGD